MPGNRPPIALRLGDEVTRPEDDIRPEEVLDDIEHARMRQIAKEPGILKMRDVHLFGPLAFRQCGDHRIDMLPQKVHFTLREDSPELEIALFLIEPHRFGGRVRHSLAAAPGRSRSHRRFHKVPFPPRIVEVYPRALRLFRVHLLLYL